MINPTWTKLLDYRGQTIGWEESHDYSCESGFALEIWSDVTGYSPSDPNAEGAWVYYLLPFVVGGTLGDITVENGAVNFSISGRTKKGSQWGRGPFAVMRNPPDGTCGPLITPFNPESPRRIFLTTCEPPEAVCGCQPLSHPQGPEVLVREDTSDTTRMTTRAAVYGTQGPYTVSWGDGTTQDLPAGVEGLSHRYGEQGTYTVAIYPTNNREQATYRQVTVPYTGEVPEPQLVTAVYEDTSDASRMTAYAEWDNETGNNVSVDWGDA